MENKEIINIGIIGTAFRKHEAKKLNNVIYDKMYNKLCELLKEIQKTNPTKQLHLISGGAAGADHLAVQYYLSENKNLCEPTFYIPAKWIDKKFDILGDGSAANYYHETFSKVLYNDKRKTLNELDQVAQFFQTGRNFKERNTLIARQATDYLIAFGFVDDLNKEKFGGTVDTWKKSKAKKKIYIKIDLLL